MVLLLVLLPILATLANAALFSPLSPVLQANHKNFRKEVLEIEKPAIVAFTAPWCGHCQRLVPEFDKAAKSLGGIIKFVNVDCEMEGNKADCQKYGVRGFPTILLFPSTKKRLPRTYQGERTAKAIGQYAVDSLPQSAKKLQAQDLAAFVNEVSSRRCTHARKPRLTTLSCAGSIQTFSDSVHYQANFFATASLACPRLSYARSLRLCARR